MRTNLTLRRPPGVAWAILVAIAFLLASSGVQAQEEGTWEAEIGDAVYGTALSGDGGVQIVGSRNNRAAAYDRAGALLWEFAPGGTVWGVGVSGDGQWTSVASEDRYLYLLDATGQPVWSIRSSHTFVDTAVSSDGARVVAVDDNRQVYVVDRVTGEVLWQNLLGDRVDAVAVFGTDPIGIVAGTRASRVHRLDANGQELWQTRFARDVLDVAVSDDGARVVAGTLDGKVALMDGATGAVAWQIDMPRPVSCTPRQRTGCVKVDISGDGARVIVGTKDGTVYLLDAGDGATLQENALGGDAISSVAISRDGETFIVGTRAGVVKSTSTAAAAASIAAAQQAQTTLLVGVVAAVVAFTAASALWVRRTESGRRFWEVRSAPARRTLALMWRRRTSYLLLTPTLALLLIFNYYPAASGLYHAFTEWVPGVETNWVGLEQFGNMVNSPYFWVGVKNAVLIAVANILKLVVPLVVAELIFNLRSSRLQYSLRTAFILPLVLPSVVGILLWVNIYDPNIGLLNQTLNTLGLGHLARAWLGDKYTAMAAILFIGFPWVGPFALLIFYGGLISIPNELFDAAKVDGANWRKRFWNIDLPMLMGAIKLLLILAFIGSLQEFQTIFLTTQGGPGNVTYTPALELYFQATRFTNYGLASAMGTALFLVILGATILNLRYVRSRTEYEPV